MALTAVRGAVGFLTRIPVGCDERAWDAFRHRPVTLPLVGYLVGAVVALPFLVPLAVAVPAPTLALTYLVAVYGLTGITHADGVMDLGDAMVVHGDAERRRAVMGDTVVGVGGTLGLLLVVSGLALGALALADLPPLVAVGIVVAAEVGTKFAMAVLVGLGTATHEGLCSALTASAGPRSLALPAVVAAPAAALTWPLLAPAAVALLAATPVALVLLAWSNSRLGGLTGDVLGAANEAGRVVALHLGVIAWTLS